MVKHLAVLKKYPGTRDVYVALARAALRGLPVKNRSALGRLLMDYRFSKVRRNDAAAERPHRPPEGAYFPRPRAVLDLLDGAALQKSAAAQPRLIASVLPPPPAEQMSQLFLFRP